MNIKLLKERLEREKVSKSLYNLNGGIGLNDRLVIEKTKEGRWSVFYTEKGCVFDTKEFNTESEACDELLKRILK